MALINENLVAGLNWYDFGGNGDVMLMVHGLGGSLANWEAVAPSFTSQFRVLALDLPGFGLSQPRGDFRISTHVSAVSRFIEAVGGPVTLVGNSMGGLVCEFVAATNPDLVNRLVLVAPATPPRLPDDRLHWPTAARLLVQAIPGAGQMLGALLRKKFDPEDLVDLSLRMVTHNPTRVPPEVVESLVDLARVRLEYPWAVTALTRSANSTAMVYRRPRDFVRVIRSIKAPTLVVHGLADRIVSPTAVEWLCSLRSDWDLVQMEDTGHTPQLDAPVRFTNVLMDWLAMTPATSGDAGNRTPH